MNPTLTREELAQREIGHTQISPWLARWMVVGFLLFIAAVPLIQLVVDWDNLQPWSLSSIRQFVYSRGERSFVERGLQKNREALAAMASFEEGLEEESLLQTTLLAPGQRLLLGFGHGNEKVYPGQRGWLFYVADMEYLMGPGFLDPWQIEQRRWSSKPWQDPIQPDPLLAIVDFGRQLARRGILLMVMPTPSKAALQPSLFHPGRYDPPLENRSWSEFVRRLREAGVALFDPGPLLVPSQQKRFYPLYLKTDTHWRPEAMEKVAKALAKRIKAQGLLAAPSWLLKRVEQEISNNGDIEAMLRLKEGGGGYPQETVTIHRVLRPGKELWQPSLDAEILLLGDSFANIYSLGGMGWGAGAGLGEQLSYFLQSPLDLVLQNDGGSFASRALLAKELSRGRDRLAGKKVVIWQFASRELALGDWKMISMELKGGLEHQFYTPNPGESREVRGTVSSLSTSRLPGSVPYKDNIVTLHLEGIYDLVSGQGLGEALVYGWGMRNNVLLPLATLRVGQEIRLRLMDWETVQGKYSTYRRSLLRDEELELELPVWGEILP